ncbi:nucleotidyltransferase [Chryseolinea lacunae]|uniref:Nucleotidyltransferase n=1 Tax=Chryseolinea lacunae TaxID=2801331 RepID=A0ABS1KPL7_9BACT|nr:nucleotidyltransferase [Chryseolinea lacunae]MBL0741399.1 nucleotidyltransferase [Chryseolinea lacunae]
MISEEGRRHLIRVCDVLNKYDVDYLIIGGAAVSHYGFSRPSGVGITGGNNIDLDFWYNPTNENYLKLLSALDKLDVETTSLRELVFDSKKTYLKITLDEFHLDFLPTMQGLKSFRDSKATSEKTNYDGAEVRFLSYDDLILNKKAINRKTDQSDIEELDKIRKGKKHSRGI